MCCWLKSTNFGRPVLGFQEQKRKKVYWAPRPYSSELKSIIYTADPRIQIYIPITNYLILSRPISLIQFLALRASLNPSASQKVQNLQEQSHHVHPKKMAFAITDIQALDISSPNPEYTSEITSATKRSRSSIPRNSAPFSASNNV